MVIARADETDLLLPLHEGVHEARPWTTFLTRLRQRVRADEAGLIISAGLEERETHLLVPATATIPDDRSWRRALRPGRAYAIEEREGFGRVVRVDEPGGATAWLAMRRKERDFTAADAALLARLAPHLAIALRTRRAVDQGRAALELSEEALARAGIAWVGFDGDGRILSMSKGAVAVLGARWAGSGVGSVAASLKDDAPQVVQVRDEASPWILLIPYREPLEASWPRLSTIGLVATPRMGDEQARAAVLATLFGLPPSEAKLAAAIAGGASLSEAADQLGLTIETARNYSKRLFAKTRTRGQLDLVRLIGSSVARLV
ncbi:helix-turn-helix transcriptional regulator [Sphingomonas sp. IC4-52]|uniref:helix-turn-helix transcriptional regulator n=1 Tax=Sphingomonas sp. IC4-52 TaxID=2887202 RepID=UPI001D106931|nr:hypothetical protein [Sphingomonas sp. IC4-52]MCC2980773.1 hypothetical protein [Sphingomonas sp. IC4-52]